MDSDLGSLVVVRVVQGVILGVTGPTGYVTGWLSSATGYVTGQPGLPGDLLRPDFATLFGPGGS